LRLKQHGNRRRQRQLEEDSVGEALWCASGRAASQSGEAKPLSCRCDGKERQVAEIRLWPAADDPIEPSATMMMGAMARMGTAGSRQSTAFRLCEARDIARSRLQVRYEMRPMTNPVNVAGNSDPGMGEQIARIDTMPSAVSRNSGVPSVEANSSVAIWCGAGSSGRSRLHATRSGR